MAVTLNMSMSYVGPGDYPNTSKVLVLVNVSWDRVHFNRDGGDLTITVDGTSIKVKAPFNANETSSGSENIYGSHWNVAHTSGTTKTVYATATFQATNQTSASPASASLQLTASGSSGGSGGGNSGNEGGSDSGGDSGGDTGGGSVTPPYQPPFKPNSFIGNVSVLGQAFSKINGDLAYDYGTGKVFFNNEGAAVIKFLTPNFSGVSTYMRVILAVSDGTRSTIHYAICSSDENYSLYCNGGSNVNDPNQIISKEASFTSYLTNGRSFDIYTDKLESQKVYYLILWHDSLAGTYLYAANNHGLQLHTTSLGGPTTLDGFVDGDFEDDNYKINSDKSIYLWVYEGEGSKVTVDRVWIDDDWYNPYNQVGVLTDYIEERDKFGLWRKYKIWDQDSLVVHVECSPGYVLNTYTVNGFKLDYGLTNLKYDGEHDADHMWFMSYSTHKKEPRIYATTEKLPKETVCIEDEESAHDEYVCYICTELTRKPRSQECNIDGSLYFRTNQYGQEIFYSYPGDGSYLNSAEHMWGNDTDPYVYCLKITTPHFEGSVTNITFNIKTLNKHNSGDTNTLMNYALCVSDANRESYLFTRGFPSDDHRIAEGTFNESIKGLSVISIDNVELLPQTEYYLIVWDTTIGSNSNNTYIAAAIDHMVVVSYIDHNDDPVYLEYVPYIAYIHNGTSWETL